MSRRRGGVSSLTVLLHLILHVTIVQSDDDISQVQHSDDWPQWLPPCALACFSLALFFPQRSPYLHACPNTGQLTE